MSESSSSYGQAPDTLDQESQAHLSALKEAGAIIYHYQPIKCAARCTESSPSIGTRTWPYPAALHPFCLIDNQPFHLSCHAKAVAEDSTSQLTVPDALSGIRYLSWPSDLSWEIATSVHCLSEDADIDPQAALIRHDMSECWLFRVPLQPTVENPEDSLWRRTVRRSNLIGHLKPEDLKAATDYINAHGDLLKPALNDGWSLHNSCLEELITPEEAEETTRLRESEQPKGDVTAVSPVCREFASTDSRLQVARCVYEWHFERHLKARERHLKARREELFKEAVYRERFGDPSETSGEESD